MSIDPKIASPNDPSGLGKLQSHCEIKRKPRYTLLKQAPSRTSLDGGARSSESILEERKQALLSAPSPAGDPTTLKILTVKAFIEISQIAQPENPLIKLLLKDLKRYHKERRKRDSLSLQEQALEKVIEDCVIVSSILIPHPSKKSTPFQDALCLLLKQSAMKVNYFKSLRANFGRRSEIGLVNDAVLEAVDPHNRGWVVNTTLWAKVLSEFKKENPGGAKNIRKFFRFVEGYSWEKARKSAPNLKITTVRYLRGAELEPYRVTILHPPGQPPLLYRNDAPYDTTHSWAIQQGEGVEIFAFKNGNLFAGKHQLGELHHSSFFAGGVADCEGEIKCVEGQLRYLNLQSGHYKPKREHAKELLQWLSDHQFDLTTIPLETVELFRIPLKVTHSISSDESETRETYYKKHFLVKYSAQDLHKELNEEGGPSPRTCSYCRESLQREIVHYYQNKYRYSDISLQLPLNIIYNPESATWIYTKIPPYILDERLSLSAITSSSCSGSQSPLGSYIELD